MSRIVSFVLLCLIALKLEAISADGLVGLILLALCASTALWALTK